MSQSINTLLEFDVTVTFGVFGKHYPETRESPEEFPEIEDICVTIGEGKNVINITNALTEDQLEDIRQQCYENMEA